MKKTKVNLRITKFTVTFNLYIAHLFRVNYENGYIFKKSAIMGIFFLKKNQKWVNCILIYNFAIKKSYIKTRFHSLFV